MFDNDDVAGCRGFDGSGAEMPFGHASVRGFKFDGQNTAGEFLVGGQSCDTWRDAGEAQFVESVRYDTGVELREALLKVVNHSEIRT